jgi:hypothetical protein
VLNTNRSILFCETPYGLLHYGTVITEMSTRSIKIIIFLGSKVQRVRRADNLTTICEPIV